MCYQRKCQRVTLPANVGHRVCVQGSGQDVEPPQDVQGKLEPFEGVLLTVAE